MLPSRHAVTSSMKLLLGSCARPSFRPPAWRAHALDKTSSRAVQALSGLRQISIFPSITKENEKASAPKAASVFPKVAKENAKASASLDASVVPEIAQENEKASAPGAPVKQPSKQRRDAVFELRRSP
eukprot:1348381-Rhodomonas_salina.1